MEDIGRMPMSSWSNSKASASKCFRSGLQKGALRSRTSLSIQNCGNLPAYATARLTLYAAMSVEGFLNFYGVLRLGQRAFDEHFERLGLVPKLRALLLVCDHLDVSRSDPLVLLLDNVAQGRNALVHPKAREVVGDLATHERASTKIPEVAREAVANMESFFEQFIHAVPSAAPSLARKPSA